jgi:hypothetical protein
MQGVQIFSSTPRAHHFDHSNLHWQLSPVATPAPSTARTDFLVPSTTDESCHRSGPVNRTNLQSASWKTELTAEMVSVASQTLTHEHF